MFGIGFTELLILLVVLTILVGSVAAFAALIYFVVKAAGRDSKNNDE